MKNQVIDLEQALRFDSLAEAEKITGRYSGESAETVLVGIGLAQQNNEVKSVLLKANNDTGSLGESWTDVMKIIADLGFQKIHEHLIKDSADIFCVFWHSEGILLKAESFMRSVNTIDAYMFFEGDYESIPPSTHGSESGNIYNIHLDGREGLRFNLNKLRGGGRFLPQWIRKPFLWLVDYQQKNEAGYDYKAITNGVLDSLPIDIQRAVCHTK